MYFLAQDSRVLVAFDPVRYAELHMLRSSKQADSLPATIKNRILWALPLLSFCLGLILMGLYGFQAWNGYQNKARLDFEHQFERLLNALQENNKSNQQLLHGVVGLFNSSDSVSREEFHRYIQGLRLLDNYPGIQAVGFTLFARRDRIENPIASPYVAGDAEYRIWPESERETLAAVHYIEPLNERNRRVLGYDNYSDPLRRKTLETVLESGRPMMTNKIILQQGTVPDVQFGYLLFVPIYHRNSADEDSPSKLELAPKN